MDKQTAAYVAMVSSLEMAVYAEQYWNVRPNSSNGHSAYVDPFEKIYG